MGQIWSNNTCPEEQCQRKARHGGQTRVLLESASETIKKFREKIQEVRAKYDQELADLWYERHGLQG